MQKRGAIHYHVVVWLPKGLTLPKPDKQGWWRHGMTNIEWARRAVGYVAKYASKGQDIRGDQLPAGARIHGCGGHEVEERQERSWWALPGWLRELWGMEHSAKRCSGGWVSRLTGEVVRSPWRLVWHSAGYERMRFEWVGDQR